MTAPVATGLCYGSGNDVGRVQTAVEQALQKAGLTQANSVFLLLTSNYAGEPQSALRAAARSAGCTQVFGASAVGILTEEEWVLDSPGVAAMVLGGDLSIVPSTHGGDLTLTLTTPAALSSQWLDEPVRRIGAVSSDEYGHGPFSVWSGSRPAKEGYVEGSIRGAQPFPIVAQGVRALTAPLEVAEVKGYDICRLGNYPALNVLIKALPQSVRQLDRIPLHMVMCGVTFGEPDTAIRQGRFRLDHIVAANTADHSVTLSHELRPGERLFWALRDKLTAEREFERAIDEVTRLCLRTPDFALMFPCLSRGPALYGDRDLDIEMLRNRFPGMPFIGFYGNGEIAPLDDGAHLYQYSNSMVMYVRESDQAAKRPSKTDLGKS